MCGCINNQLMLLGFNKRMSYVENQNNKHTVKLVAHHIHHPATKGGDSLAAFAAAIMTLALVFVQICWIEVLL